jgi:hypothetical protein
LETDAAGIVDGRRMSGEAALRVRIDRYEQQSKAN